MSALPRYPFHLTPLPESDGGGWFITFPDLPGCVSDGATPDEAIANGKDALLSWLRTASEFGDSVPAPGEGPIRSGEFRARVPQSLHVKLAARAEQEGVSMNTLLVAILAEALGKRECRGK